MVNSYNRVTSSRGRNGQHAPARPLQTSFRCLGVAFLLLGLGAALPGVVHAANVCNANISILYQSGPDFAIPSPTASADNTYRVQLTLGAGAITGGTLNVMDVNAVDFGLDCTFPTVGNTPCTSDGGSIKFLDNIGNISAGCTNSAGQPVNVVTSHGSSASPNDVIFSFTINDPGQPDNGNVTGVRVPANTATCSFQFDVQVVGRSSGDGTPTFIEENTFYNPATCDNGLPSSGAQSASVETCSNQFSPPQCATLGQVGAPPGCVQLDCNDGNGCTVDQCSTSNGTCSSVDTVSSTCNDDNACTADSCNPANGGCQHVDTVTSTCSDGNGCTVDSCNPSNGACQSVDTVSSTCNDGNACTVDSCNPATGECQGIDTVSSTCDDGNACTVDSCNPATGECQHVFNPNISGCVPTIPTLSEWGMFALIALLALVGMVAVRRRLS